MGSRLFSPSSFLYLLCFVQVVHVKIQPSLADPDDYISCSFQFQCGKITAGFPFWGGDRPVACGHRNLQLNCEYNVATMTIGDVKYVVLNVDERAQVLKIARQDYQDGICPPKLINTTFDSAIIDLSAGYAMLSLSYGCPLKLNTGQETCDNNDISCLNGLIYSGEPGECNNKVNIPVAETLRSEAECNISALEIAVQEGFEVKWKLSSIACGSCTISNGSCGYDDVSNQTICYCPDGKLNISTTCSASTSRGSSFNNKRNIFIGIAAGVVGIIVTLVILLIVGLRRYRNKTTDNDKKVEAFIRNYESLAPRRYKYSDKTMTKSFSHKLGQGGYGDVYKGKLPNDRLVAVKVIKGSRGNGEEYINEVASITRTSHVNIVTLVGFCHEKKKRALIYEFMPNGSLDKFIYDKESSSTTRKLEWRTMYQIAVGIARGLEYLHRGCNIRIVHFDIKPHNILLDEDFCPKISDFGLAKQSEKKESTISLRDERGTRGYTAPEVSDRSLGGVSHKSDVYSYGMMILEIVGGRKNLDPEVSNLSEIYFPNSVYKHIEPGNDFQLHGVINEEEKEIAKKMITVSFWCIQKNPSDRPSMTKVVEMLEGSIESLPIPPKPSLS